MQFIVSDGTGLPNATSLVSVEFADEFISFFFPDSSWNALDPVDDLGEKQLRLIQATDHINYLLNWTSTLVNNEQALNWPRQAFTDKQGRIVTDGAVPKLIKDAVATVAHVGMDKDIEDAGVLLRSEKFGDTEDRYAGAVKVGGNKEIGSVRKRLMRAGYGKSAVSIVEVLRA